MQSSPLARLLTHPWVLWIVLALPAVYWLYAWWRESMFYGQVLHLTGDFAVQLLIVTMAVTPLRLLFPKAAWVRGLLRRRRHLGVAAFGYSLLHTVVYIQRHPELAFILEDASEFAMWTGWLAFFLMLALALTSNDAAVRLLGRGWKRLHRVVYLAAALVFVHWIFSAFDPTVGYIHLGVLVALEALRLALPFFARRGSATRS